MAAIDEFSRFKTTQQITVDGNETFGVWNPPSWITTRPDDKYIGVLKITSDLEKRPDKISQLVYGTPLLEWVIIAFNNATTLNWPPVGSIVEYPVETLVYPELLS